MRSPRRVITVGNFDGVHAGHAALVRRARELAGADGRVVALVFEPHPATGLAHARVPVRLSTFEQRRGWLSAVGVDAVEPLEPTDELLRRTPEEFVAWACQRWSPTDWVEGPDFHFGRGRAGDVNALAALGRGHGFAVHVVPPVSVVLADHTIATASSTLVRWLLAHGRVDDASRVLGRPHEVEGHVGPGDRRGRAIGFPTANVRTECALPADGVYAVRARLEDGRALPAAVNIGVRPTFDGTRRLLEAHLIGAPKGTGDAIAGLPEYGWGVRLEFVAWLRDQVRFASVEALVDQLARDVARARDLINTPGHAPRPAEAVA